MVTANNCHVKRAWVRALAGAAAVMLCAPAVTEVLPEDRADILYHSYDGGGVTIDGPSLLVRKKAGKKFSFSGNYYVDSVSSASIDVVTTASPYSEERTQTSLGFDFLHGDYIMSVGYSQSDENDYSARSYHFGISQTMFGDLTTLSLGYSLGDDEVGNNTDDTFSDELRRQNYRLGLSQILTKNLLMGLSYELITDEGFLNNPYRSVRFVDPNSAIGYSFESEIYPRTRTSDAVALRGRYYLPYRAALHAEYRFFTDSWGIEAQTAELGYTHTLKSGWIIDFKLRNYSQTSADFYSDLFPREQAQNFLARDKELSTFDSQTISLGASYDILRKGWSFIDKGSVSVYYDRIDFQYDDFRDLTAGGGAGAEPFYSFSADVLQLFVSFWY